jgi:hypothetical protein
MPFSEAERSRFGLREKHPAERHEAAKAWLQLLGLARLQLEATNVDPSGSWQVK